MKVGVIGLGSMGMGAALNLHRKGHTVTGCEPRESARAEFSEAQCKSVVSGRLKIRVDTSEPTPGVIHRGLKAETLGSSSRHRP